MAEKFVPANEIAHARVQRTEIKRNDFKKLQEYVSKFEDLVMLCMTEINEAYIYFFSSLSRSMKENVTEKFPISQWRTVMEIPIHRQHMSMSELYSSP